MSLDFSEYHWALVVKWKKRKHYKGHFNGPFVEILKGLTLAECREISDIYRNIPDVGEVSYREKRKICKW